VAVLIGLLGLVVLLVGCIVSLAAAENIRHAVTMSHWPTAAGVYIGIALAAVGAVLGVVTLVQWLARRGSVAPLIYSIGAVVPLLVIVFLIRPAIH
jgi:cytochrome c biogenesis protein CcdA